MYPAASVATCALLLTIITAAVGPNADSTETVDGAVMEITAAT